MLLPVLPRCLIVDDDISFLSVVTATLERHHIQTDVVMTGTDALLKTQKSAYAAVLLDLKLPDLDGIEVLRKIRAQGNQSPVILITGAGTIPSAVESMRHGAADFVEKPVRMVELVGLIQSLSAGSSPSGSHASRLVAVSLMTVIKSAHDTSTVESWARRAALAAPTLRSRCSLAGEKPKSCLDLGRLLRVRHFSPKTHRDLGDLLDNRDLRTISGLFTSAGLSLDELTGSSIEDVLNQQRLIRNRALLSEIFKLL